MAKKEEVENVGEEGEEVSEEKKDDSDDEPKITDVPGIGPGIATKLEAAGVYDLMGLAVMSPPALSDMAGIGEAVARKAIQAARDMMKLGFMSGDEFAKKREDVVYITTGSQQLNDLLGGKGVETRSMTETYGAFGSGKSQLAFTLAVNVQMPVSQGGGGGKAVFIDTEGTFRPERIKQIAEGIGANPEKALKNIFVARAFNSDHQMLLLDKVSELIKNGEPIKLLIIDSLTAHFRAEFAGRGQLADRQQKLNRYLHDLMRVAEQHNLAVFVTNQVMANPAMMFGDPTTAIGGNIVGHACLTKDSLIQLSDGSIIEISKIEMGKRVLSGDFGDMGFEGCENEQVFVNPDVDKIYNIKTNCQIDCSSLHRFFGISGFEIVEKEVKDLNVGDFVAQAGKVEIIGEERILPQFKVKRTFQNISKFSEGSLKRRNPAILNAADSEHLFIQTSLKKIGKISKGIGGEVKEKLTGMDVTRKEICDKIGITPRQFRRVLNQEYPTSFEVLDNLSGFVGGQVLQVIPVFSNKHKDLIMPEVLNSSLAQTFGYFIGDGNLEARGLRFRDERIGVLEVYQGLFKQLFNVGGVISKMKDKNCHTLNINSKEIRDFFEMLVPRILEEVGKSKKEVVGAFVKGFVDAEGHINKKRAHITIAQKERNILRYIQLFLLRLGVRSTIKFDIGEKNMNILRVADRDVESYLQIGFSAVDKQERLLECVNSLRQTYSYEMMPVKREELRKLLESCGLKFSKFIRPRSRDYKWVSRNELENAFKGLMNCEVKDRQIKAKIDFIFKLLNSDIRFEKIREINVSDNIGGEKLFDFSVPGNENYVANGFVVHNSTYRLYLRRGKQGSRVAKMIDSPNLPDNECQFWVTEKGVGDED